MAVVRTGTRSKRDSDDELDALHRPTKKGRTGKRLLNSLVETVQRNVEAEKRIVEHKASLEKSWEQPVTINDGINERLLGQVVQNDENDPAKAHRLLLALQRTQVTRSDTVFYFFEDTSEYTPVYDDFPIESLPKQRWASNFEGQYIL